MAKIKCIKCGNTLSNSSSPSENIIKVFPDEVVSSVLLHNPDMRFFDFETNKYTDYEYWFCSHCNSVYCIENKPSGCAKYVYSKSDNESELLCEDISDWKRLWIFSDSELYNYDEPEEHWLSTVKDFFDYIKPVNMFCISDDKKTVVVTDCQMSKILAVYNRMDF